jgi:hypothetical protein
MVRLVAWPLAVAVPTREMVWGWERATLTEVKLALAPYVDTRVPVAPKVRG